MCGSPGRLGKLVGQGRRRAEAETCSPHNARAESSPSMSIANYGAYVCAIGESHSNAGGKADSSEDRAAGALVVESVVVVLRIRE